LVFETAQKHNRLFYTISIFADLQRALLLQAFQGQVFKAILQILYEPTSLDQNACPKQYLIH